MLHMRRYIIGLHLLMIKSIMSISASQMLTNSAGLINRIKRHRIIKKWKNWGKNVEISSPSLLLLGFHKGINFFTLAMISMHQRRKKRQLGIKIINSKNKPILVETRGRTSKPESMSNIISLLWIWLMESFAIQNPQKAITN